MATQEKTWNVANRLHSLKDSDNPEVNHIIAGADEIYDDAKGAKQSDINAQTETALADRYTKVETYSKEQLDSLITTPDVKYVTVATFADLPQPGEANTIYRVSSYDGTQVDASKYALYAWNGATYQLLAVRSAVGEVYDISANHADTKYADLAAALGANGANVPQSLRKGGMSVKFVQSSDNKYVQFRFILSGAFTSAQFTNINNWQGIDEKPKVASHNMVESNGVAVTKANAVYSKNLYNPNRVLDGYFFWSYNDNTPQQDANYCISDYIPVSGDIILNKTTGSGTGHRVYDKNGNIIAYFTTSQYTYNASRGDAYVRFSIKKSWSNVQIESGTTSTSYVPWTDKNDVVEPLNQNVESLSNRISANENGIYNINSQLNALIYSDTVTAETTVSTGIKLQQGKSYLIKNQASNGAIVVYNNYGGTNHQVGVLNAGVSLTYNCSNDGEVYVYTSVANVNISVYKKALGYQVDKNTKDIQTINDKINNTKTVKTDGSGDFTTILDAALYAKAHPNTNLIIRVFAGTYDIIQEFEDKYGETYFSSMTEGEYGIPIGFGETWEFAAGAKIEAIYSGDNYDVVTKSFSVFFTEQGQGYYDFTLIGANIKAQNVKYCVHDENVISEIPYTHTYKNCQMKIIQDGSSSWAEPWYALRCIGGGLGKSGNIIIDGCYFDGDNEFTNDTLVSYHNSFETNAMSFIKVANSYFDGTKTISVSYIGTSQNITKCIITNNSVGKAPYKKAENASAQVDNVELLAWNNIVRA